MQSEDIQQSSCSPGPVLSEEVLLRAVYFPGHIDDSGNLQPEAIPTQDLKIRGFSVHRRLYVRKKKILSDIERYVSRKEDRKCVGIAPVECDSIRAIRDNNNNQAFNVLDDAKSKEDFAHAKIMITSNYGRAVVRSLRSKLIDEIRVIHDADEIVSNLPYDKILNRIKYSLGNWLKCISNKLRRFIFVP